LECEINGKENGAKEMEATGRRRRGKKKKKKETAGMKGMRGEKNVRKGQREETGGTLRENRVG